MRPEKTENAVVDTVPPFTLQRFPPLPKIAPPHLGRRITCKLPSDCLATAPTLVSTKTDESDVNFTSSDRQSPSHSSTTERSAADRFARTFELVEDVLSRLQLLDILRARGTSTRFRDVVDKSSQLQTILGLKPPQKAGYSMPLLEVEAGNKDKCFDFYLRRSDWSALGEPIPPISFSVSITFDAGSFQPGSIARKMYISYPPFECIRLRPVCHCKKDRIGPDGSIRLDENEYYIKANASRPEGLTLGDLLDVSERLRVQHVRCAWKHEEFKRTAGFRPNSFEVNIGSVFSTESDELVELQKLHEATYAAPPTSAGDEIGTECRQNFVFPDQPALPASSIPLRTVEFTKIRYFDYGVIVIGSEGIEQWTTPTEKIEPDEDS